METVCNNGKARHPQIVPQERKQCLPQRQLEEFGRMQSLLVKRGRRKKLSLSQPLPRPVCGV